MSSADWTTSIATCFIAAAAFANVYVYYGMWKQTGDFFRETYRPRLSVSIRKCEYSETDGCFKGRIVTTNHGTAVANDVNLRIAFGYSNFVKSINRIAIQPQNKIVYTFSLAMTSDGYRTGQTQGNRLNVMVEGSYKGLADHEYSYGERQDYEPELKRFVPIWAK